MNRRVPVCIIDGQDRILDRCLVGGSHVDGDVDPWWRIKNNLKRKDLALDRQLAHEGSQLKRCAFCFGFCCCCFFLQRKRGKVETEGSSSRRKLLVREGKMLRQPRDLFCSLRLGERMHMKTNKHLSLLYHLQALSRW